MGVFDGYAGDMQQQAAARPMPQAQPRGGGGLGGFLFNNFIKPTVNTVAGLPSDLLHAGKAVGIAGGSVLQGQHGAALQKSKQQALNQVNQIPMLKGVLPNTVSGVQKQSLGTQAEKLGGATASNVLNVMGPEDVALKQGAKMGLKQLAGQGIKSGIKYGAAGGAANSMAQGQTGGQVVNSALLGGATGGAVGLAGGTIGAGVGKLAGAKGSATGERNALQNAAYKYGQNEATNQAAAVDQGFRGLGKVLEGSPSATGKSFGYNNAKTLIGKLGLPMSTPDELAQSMHALNAANEEINGHLTNVLQNVGDKHITSPEEHMTDILKNYQDTLGSVSSGGAAHDTAQTMRDILGQHLYGGRGNLEGQAVNPANILDAVRALEGKAANMGISETAQAQASAYRDLAGRLEAELHSKPISEAVAGYKIPADQLERIQNMHGPLADYIQKAVNEGGRVSDLRTAMHPGVVAGRIAKAYDKSVQSNLEKPVSGGSMGGATYDSSAAMSGNPVGLVQLFNRMSGGNLGGRVASKLAPGSAEAGAAAGAQRADQLLNESNPIATGAAGGIPPTPATQPGTTPSLGNPIQGGIQGAMGALTGATAVGAGSMGNQMLTQPQSQQAPTPGPTDQAQMTGSDTSQMPDMSNANNNSMYGAANMMADISRDPKNASTYMALYKMFNPTQSASATTIKPNAQQYGEATSGLQSLQQLQDMIGKNPNIVNQTAIPGQGLPLVGGMIRNAAGTGDYQAAAQNTLDALARARTGAAMSKQEEAFYQRMLPQAGDSPDTIDFKLKQLSQAFQPFLQINQSQPQDMSQLQGATQ